MQPSLADQAQTFRRAAVGEFGGLAVERGMSMEAALKLGSRRAAAAPRDSCQQFDSDDCRTRAATGVDKSDLRGRRVAAAADVEDEKPAESAGSSVPRDGIEPPTRGFSIPEPRGVGARNHGARRRHLRAV